MTSHSLEAQIDSILRDIRRSHSRNEPFYIELACDDGKGDLNIQCVPDGTSWLLCSTGRVILSLTVVQHDDVVKTCRAIMRLAFDAKWREKGILDFKKSEPN